MTDQSPFSADDQRDGLRARIEAAERRNAERTLAEQAREAADTAVEYTRAHPLTVIGGALALGLAIGLMTRPGRDAARKVVGSASGAASSAGASVRGAASSAKANVKGAASRGQSRIGAMIGQAAVGYVMTLIDEVVEAARTGQERAEELGDSASVQARKLRSEAGEAANTAAANTRSFARKTRDAATAAVRDLSRKTKD